MSVREKIITRPKTKRLKRTRWKSASIVPPVISIYFIKKARRSKSGF
jgi:hypothetical protein